VAVTEDDCDAAIALKRVEENSLVEVPGMLGPFAVAIGLTCDTAAVVVRPIPSDPTSASASAMETDENPAVTLSICWSFKGWGWPAAATPAMNGNAVKAISSFFISLS
jgi:hypothetical protein